MALPEKPEALVELRARLALWRIKGVGPTLFRKLLQQFGSAHGLLTMKAVELRQHAVAPALVEALQHPDWWSVDLDCKWLDHAQQTLLWIDELRLTDNDRMPTALNFIPQAPPLLFVKGDPSCLLRLQIAMVGSRKPSAYGLAMGYELAMQIAALGVVIVSGLAIGIDSQCQRGALTVGGQSIAVLAVGLDRIYPRQNQALAEDLLAQGGALISEFPLQTPPLPEYFPRRNRLISGLSVAVIVVEATLKSGSLITARYAAEQGREVFAMPGPVRQGHYQGCHALIKEGAVLLETISDLVAVIPQLIDSMKPSKPSDSKRQMVLTELERQLLEVCEEMPLSCQELQLRMPLSIEELSVLLTNLIVKGYLIEEALGYRLTF